MADFIIDGSAESLQQAIDSTNNLPGTDTVIINSDIELDTAITITDSLNIIGNGSSISQTQSDRIFNIDDNSEEKSLVQIENLNLSNGNPDNSGGAILSKENLSIVNSNFTNNAARSRGGAVFVDGADLKVENSLFEGNQIDNNPVTSAGGAIHVRNGKLDIFGSQITDNIAAVGGGISIVNSTANIDNTSVDNNNGGGIAVVDRSSLNLVNSSLNTNVAGIVGGGLLIDGEAFARITDSSIEDNLAGFGGGIAVQFDSSSEIIDTSVFNNLANDSGGGIDVFENSSLSIQNSTVTNNSAKFGGGIAVQVDSSSEIINTSIVDNTANDLGGGINVFDNSFVSIQDSTVTDNWAEFGGGIVSTESEVLISSSEIMDNAFTDVEGEVITLAPADDDVVVDGDRSYTFELIPYNAQSEQQPFESLLNDRPQLNDANANYVVIEDGSNIFVLEPNADTSIFEELSQLPNSSGEFFLPQNVFNELHDSGSLLEFVVGIEA